jgi:hypothetical protein
MDEAQAFLKLKSKLSDRLWRLENLYKIRDKNGKDRLFKLNAAQKLLYNNLWFFNVILKARQLGMTTFSMIYFLDACLFNSNHAAGIVAHTREDAEDLFENKIKYAYDNLPEWLKAERSAKSDTAKKLSFSNGSSITVGTSLRSGTYQKLLISEYGKVSAKYPDKAREIKTGALNTVAHGQQIFVESTAEGKAGEFYDLCERARKLSDLGKELTMAEPRFHFFPWYTDPEYCLNERETISTVIPDKISKYLDNLKVELSDGQRAWYAAKAETQGEDMKREYPSTPEEAFEGSLEGAFYTEIMAKIRRDGRIRPIPVNASYPVFTAWDLGLNDQMSIWFFQYINGELYFVDYHESSNEGWGFYARLLKDKGYLYDTHFFPHDGNTRIRTGTVTTDKQMAQDLGIRPIKVIPVTSSVAVDIRNYCRPSLPMSYFDEAKCTVGIRNLDNYKKKWDKVAGMFSEEPQHDSASHGADAYRTAARAFKTGQLEHIPVTITNKTAPMTTSTRFRR